MPLPPAEPNQLNDEDQEEARRAAIQQKLKTAAKLKMAGQAQKSAGEAAQAGASFVINAGRFLINTGLSAASTIVGIILTVILVPMGAIILALGMSMRAAGAGAKTTGELTKLAGQKKEIEAAKLAGQSGGKEAEKTKGGNLNPLNFQNLISSDTGPAGFLKTLLPADPKDLLFTCGTCFVGLMIGLILFVVVLLGVAGYACTIQSFNWCEAIAGIVALFKSLFK